MSSNSTTLSHPANSNMFLMNSVWNGESQRTSSDNDMTNEHDKTTTPSNPRDMIVHSNSNNSYNKKQDNTPATTIETPMTEGSLGDYDGRTLELSSPTYIMKSPYWTSSNATPDQSADFIHYTNTNTTAKNPMEVIEPCARDPSPQQEGRNLFNEHSRDDFPPERSPTSFYYPSAPTTTIRREELVRHIQSVGPGVPVAATTVSLDHESTDQFQATKDDLMSSSSRSHRLRSRRFQSTEDENALSSSYRGQRRRQSRNHPLSSSVSRSYNSDSNTNSFSLSVVSIEDEVSVSSTDDSNMDLSSSSPRRRTDRKYRSRQRRKQLSGSMVTETNGSGVGDQSNSYMALFVAKFPIHRLANTKSLVWLLCLVGMVSVSMIVMTSHKITKSLDYDRREHEDHVTVMFGKSGNNNLKGRTTRILPKIHQSTVALPSTLLGGIKSPETLSRGTVNLHKLSQVQEDRPVLELINDKAKLQESKDKDDKGSHHTKTKIDEKADDHHHTTSRHKQHVSHNGKKKQKHMPSHHDMKKEVIHTNHDHTPHISFSNLEMSVIPVVAPKQEIITDDNTAFDLFDRHFLYSEASSSLSNGSESRRIVMIGSNYIESMPSPRKVKLYPSPYSDNTQMYPVLDSRDDADDRIHTMEMRAPYVQGECKPMADWQITFNPSCNGMHEIDVASVEGSDSEENLTLFGKNGFWRNAWRYDNPAGGHTETVVLKTLK
jgi:hypothetical protein